MSSVQFSVAVAKKQQNQKTSIEIEQLRRRKCLVSLKKHFLLKEIVFTKT